MTLVYVPEAPEYPLSTASRLLGISRDDLLRACEAGEVAYRNNGSTPSPQRRNWKILHRDLAKFAYARGLLARMKARLEPSAPPDVIDEPTPAPSPLPPPAREPDLRQLEALAPKLDGLPTALLTIDELKQVRSATDSRLSHILKSGTYPAEVADAMTSAHDKIDATFRLAARTTQARLSITDR